MKLASPVFRFSFSLVLLTTSILLVSDMLGLVADRRAADIEARKAISEALAVQLSVAVTDKYRSTVVVETLNAVKTRNRQIRSVALRTTAGDIIAFAGDHSSQWKPSSDGKSTITDVQVPIFRDGQPWGRVEIHFAPLAGAETWFGVPASILTVSSFVALAGFLVYVLFLKRSLHELDPSAVIPHRVREALDALAEGLLIIDQSERIVLANAAFARRLGYPVETLLGRPVSELGWEFDSEAGLHAQPPWVKVLHGDKASTNVPARSELDIGRAAVSPAPSSRVLAAAGRDAAAKQISRLLLFDRIDQAIGRARRNSAAIAVLMLEFDVAQRILGTFGHLSAEKLIEEALQRIRQVLRGTDTVASRQDEDDTGSHALSRLSSGEVSVLLSELRDPAQTTWIINRIFAAFEPPVVVDGNEVYVGATVGVSLYPVDGADADALITRASAAMCEARAENGRNKCRYFSSDIDTRARNHMRIEQELHRAIERQEFVLNYQPQVDLATGWITGIEALVRWQHPELGLISPAEFIPIAEHTGLINPIGAWVIATACAQARIWQDAGCKDLVVAVNLSPAELRDPAMGRRIIAAVHHAGIPMHSLEVEVTETTVISDVDTAVAILQELHAAGIRIALDDFGTGYSSLSYLKKFPVDSLKIDRSFLIEVVQNRDDANIVCGLISLAHSLGLHVVAEGVETEAQLQFLQDMGCDAVQGYLLSRPVARDAASALLADQQAIRRIVMQTHQGKGRSVAANGIGMVPRELLGILNEAPAANRRDWRMEARCPSLKFGSVDVASNDYPR